MNTHEELLEKTTNAKGFCMNCNRDVLHVRCFNSPVGYWLDKISFHLLEKFGLGPWQCVDCTVRNFRLLPSRNEGTVAATPETEQINTQERPVGNFIRTEHSLANNVVNSDRFTAKYRNGIVERLLAGKTTVSRTCNDLNVSELEIQRWIRDYLQYQLDKISESASGSLIPTKFAGVTDDGALNWSHGNDDVIEVSVVRKPR